MAQASCSLNVSPVSISPRLSAGLVSLPALQDGSVEFGSRGFTSYILMKKDEDLGVSGKI